MSGTPLVMMVTKVVMVVMNLLSIDVVESHGWLDQEVDENQDCLLPIDYLVTKAVIKMVSMAVVTGHYGLHQDRATKLGSRHGTFWMATRRHQNHKPHPRPLKGLNNNILEYQIPGCQIQLVDTNQMAVSPSPIVNSMLRGPTTPARKYSTPT